MRALNHTVAEIAHTDIPVLIVGESGTGKEIYARLIHRLSGVAGLQPRKIDCRGTEAGKLSAELHAAFTEAERREISGSLFLDGVDELDLSMQRLLLSLLSEKEWNRSDGLAPSRLISSATGNLEAALESGSFRRELYFRLNGACLRLPPLRERKEDIVGLSEHFLNKHSKDTQRGVVFDEASLSALKEYSWPGNIRELENFARKVAALGCVESALYELRSSRFQVTKVFVRSSPSSLKDAAREASRECERELILGALQRTKWNRKRAAQELKISYKSLLYKIKQIEGAKALLQGGGEK
jgi:two-component system, NtrC family, response regulator AtoC